VHLLLANLETGARAAEPLGAVPQRRNRLAGASESGA
jgi:hypothetical protein